MQLFSHLATNISVHWMLKNISLLSDKQLGYIILDILAVCRLLMLSQPLLTRASFHCFTSIRSVFEQRPSVAAMVNFRVHLPDSEKAVHE
jgi:hypothetical protein